jgi:hypothetical protein
MLPRSPGCSGGRGFVRRFTPPAEMASFRVTSLDPPPGPLASFGAFAYRTRSYCCTSLYVATLWFGFVRRRWPCLPWVGRWLRSVSRREPWSLASFGAGRLASNRAPSARVARELAFGKGRTLIIESGTSRVLPFHCRVRYSADLCDPRPQKRSADSGPYGTRIGLNRGGCVEGIEHPNEFAVASPGQLS